MYKEEKVKDLIKDKQKILAWAFKRVWVMKLLFFSFKPILYSPCLVLGLKLCRPHFCFASCCYLLGSGNEVSGRTHKARGRRRNVLLFVGSYLFPVPWASCQECFSAEQRQLLPGAESESSLQFFLPLQNSPQCNLSETPALVCQHSLCRSLSLNFTDPSPKPLGCNNANILPLFPHL